MMIRQPQQQNTQAKIEGFASELVDIFHLQETVVVCNRVIADLLSFEVKDLFQRMSEDDDKNYRLINMIILNLGLQVKPREFTKRLCLLASEVIHAKQASTLEKLYAYGLLRQNQLMCSQMVHKAVRLISQSDIKEALAQLEGLEVTMDKHADQFKTIMESVGVKDIIGEAVIQRQKSRPMNAIPTTEGKVIHKVGKLGDEKNILDLLRIDHRQVMALFFDMEASSDEDRTEALFQQLRIDLTFHAEAEDEAVYNWFRRYNDLRGRLDEVQNEHELLHTRLDAIAMLEVDSDDFKTYTQELRDFIKHHIDEEEDLIFKLLQEKASEDELVRLADAFIQVKEKLHEEQNRRFSDLSA